MASFDSASFLPTVIRNVRVSPKGFVFVVIRREAAKVFIIHSCVAEMVFPSRFILFIQSGRGELILVVVMINNSVTSLKSVISQIVVLRTTSRVFGRGKRQAKFRKELQEIAFQAKIPSSRVPENANPAVIFHPLKFLCREYIRLACFGMNMSIVALISKPTPWLERRILAWWAVIYDDLCIPLRIVIAPSTDAVFKVSAWYLLLAPEIVPNDPVFFRIWFAPRF